MLLYFYDSEDFVVKIGNCDSSRSQFESIEVFGPFWELKILIKFSFGFSFRFQARRKWNTKLDNGTRNASLVASAKRQSAPSRLFHATKRSTVPVATRRNMQHAARNARKWAIHGLKYFRSIFNWNFWFSGDYIGWCHVQERSMASWMFHVHSLWITISWSTFY